MPENTEKPKTCVDAACAHIKNLANNISTGKFSSNMSACIYDTAWVSMVIKDGTEEGWLFPTSFQYVLHKQQPDGSWKEPGESELDGILNTMAALLACIKHRDFPKYTETTQKTIVSSICKATNWLSTAFPAWDIMACDQVGFEILVPSLLDLLHLEGVVLVHPSLEQLLLLQGKKIAKLDLGSLYHGVQSTIVHCLEALVGKVDFDRLEPLLRQGCMMGSPAATAAFLIYSKKWNEDAENYLHEVYLRSASGASGGFPSAYPAEVFEISWVLSTFIEAGFTVDTLDKASVIVLQDYLATVLKQNGDIIGFNSTSMPDADDTAKSLLCLYMLGDHHISSNALVQNFSQSRCFRTYAAERNPSFSANCNIIKALLHSNDRDKFTPEIESAVHFVFSSWYNGTTRDKWNTSQQYSCMLLSEVLIKLLYLKKIGDYRKFPKELTTKASIIASQILSYTLCSQEADGSWGSGCHEVTAYAILTLITLMGLPQAGLVAEAILSAIQRGRMFIKDIGNWQASVVWIEKVTYSSQILTDAYCIAALYASEPCRISISPALIKDKMSKQLEFFFGSLPLFVDIINDPLFIKTVLVEASAFLDELKQIQHNIFPRGEKHDDRYLEYIPFTWISCNKILGSPLTPILLWEMMEISMLNFQVDHYIETVVKSRFKHDLSRIRSLVDRLCALPYLADNNIHRYNGTGRYIKDADTINGNDGHAKRLGHNHGEVTSGTDLEDIETIFATYASRILTSSYVKKCSPALQDSLRASLAGYLQAQLTSIIDNDVFTSYRHSSNTGTHRPTPPSLFTWARTTGADHTSCPYSFNYFLCLLSASTKEGEVFMTPVQKYVSSTLCRMLATMCRMYNDYGSLMRDREEGTFGCFGTAELDIFGITDEDKVKMAKSSLMSIAQFERSLLNSALARLEAETEENLMGQLRLFINVTDLYGQIYIARDIGARVL